MEAKSIELKSAGLCLVAILLVELAAAAIFGRFGFPSIAVLGITRILEILVLLTIFVRFGEQGIAAIGLYKSQLMSGLKKGVIWSIGFGFMVAVVFGLFLALHINLIHMMKAPMPLNLAGIMAFFFIGGLVSPVAEEMFFRGVLYGFFRRWGIWIALIISTVLFVMPHWTKDRIPIPQIVGGILFAVAYETEKNLIVPITIHILGNLSIFSIALLTR